MSVLSQTGVMVLPTKQQVEAPRPVQILETSRVGNECGRGDDRERMNSPAAGRS